MGARYFTTETLDFLQDLEINNERAWFEANKDRYETHVREPALRLVADLGGPLHETVSPHLVADPRKVGGSMFRINRDVRFSHDKSPYKTHCGIALRHEQGRDTTAPTLYVHIEPGNCFLGGGIYRPSTDALRRLRQAIVDDPDAWVAARDAVPIGWEFLGESLTRAPKGFDADHPLIDDLKRKSLIVRHGLSEREVTGTKLLDRIVERAADTKPLLAWSCRALDLPF